MKITVQDFGPIGHAEIELAPLTVLVGANSTGKSYLAVLLYSLLRTYGWQGLLPIADWSFLDHLDTLQVVLRKLAKVAGVHERQVGLSETPPSEQDAVRKMLANWEEAIKDESLRQIKACFACEPRELVRRDAATCSHVILSANGHVFSSEIMKEGKHGGKAEVDLSSLRLHVMPHAVELKNAREGAASILIGTEVILHIQESLFHASYYLPAARSGFLSSHRLLASALVSRSSMSGGDPTQAPQVSGVVTDFISTILQFSLKDLEKPRTGSEVASFLEQEMSGGIIEMSSGESVATSDIRYRHGDLTLPLTRCSSMIAEIAPIILLLKHRINKGDLLFIEEPEAHLHPDNQRILARGLVKLVRRGIHVLVTTHSDFFLQQVSNFVMLSAKPEERRALGYDEEDYLDVADVAGYLLAVERPEEGSVSHRLECTVDDGIVDDAFGRVAEALCNEKAHIEQSSENR